MHNYVRACGVKMVSLACLLAGASLNVCGFNGTWIPTAGVDQAWPMVANWAGTGPGYPLVLGDNAALTSDLSAAQTINLGGTMVVSSMLLGDGAAPYYPFTVGPTALLTLDVAAGNALISKSGPAADLIAAPITLNDNLVVVNNQNSVNQPLVFGGAIGGAKSVSVNGVGADSTIEFNNANGFTGGLILNAGLVRASRAALALGNGALTLNGGIVELLDNNALSFARPTTVNSNVVIVTDRQTDGPWVRHTMGTLSIGNQTLSVDAGSHVQPVGGERGWQELVFGATTLRENGAILDAGADTHLTLGALSGNYSLTKQGTGRLELATAATRTSGGTTLEEGVLRLRIATALGATASTGPLYLNGGALSLMAAASTFASTATTLGDDLTIEVGPAAFGAGVTHILGTLSIGNNTLSVRKNVYVGSGSAGLTFGATTLTGSTVFDVSDGTPTASTIHPSFPLGVLTLGAVGGTGGLTKTGSGALTLATAGNFSGPVAINQGTVKLGNATGLGTTDGATTVTAGSMLEATAVITVTEPLNLSGTGLNGWGALVNKSANAAIFSGPVALDGGVRMGPYAAGAITLSGPVTGSSVAFEKVGYGAGAVVFSGANTFTGTTTVTAGKLQLGYATQNNSKLDDAGNLILAGGNIDLTGGSHTEVVGGTVLDAGASSVTRAANTSTLRMNTITRNPGATVNIGAASIAATDNLNVNGILGGWATLVNEWAINSTSAGDGPITALATYETGAETAWVSNKNAKVNAAVTMTASRQLYTLILAQTAARTLNIGAGQTLRLEDGGLLGSGNFNAIIQNGTLTAGAGDDVPGELIIQGNSAVANPLTISSTIANNGSGAVTLTKSGIGALLLSGPNTYSGNTYLNGGKLILNNNNALGNGDGTLRIRQATTIDATVAGITLDGNPQIWDGDFTFTGTQDLNLGNGTVSLGTIPAGTTPFATRVVTTATANKTLTVGGVISGDFGLSKAGNVGILALGGANTYSGDTIISAGAVVAPLRLAASNVIPNGAGKGNVSLTTANGVLDMNGYDDTINGLFSTVASFVDNTMPSSTSTLTIGDNDVSSTFGTALFRNTGSGAALNIVKIGSGVLYLSGANSHIGTTTVNGGTLRMGNIAALGTAAGGTTVNTGGTLDINGQTMTALEPITFAGGMLTNFSATAGTLAGPVTLSSDTIVNGGLTGILLGGSVSGSSSLTKKGVGYLYLNGDNSAFNGDLTIDAGLVRLVSAGTVGTNGLGSVVGTTTVKPGAMLDLYGQVIGAEPLTISGFGNNYGGALLNNHATVDASLAGPVTLDGDTAIFVNTAARKLTLSGKVSGSYGLEKVGAGILVLGSTANDFTGDILVRAGTLRLGSANVIPDGAGKGDLNLITTLDLNGNSETINGLFGQGGITTLVAGSPILTVGANNANSAYSGVFAAGSGTAGLTKIGSGTLILSGASTFTGPTRIEDGTVRVSAAGALGGAGQLQLAGGELKFVNNAALIIAKSAVTVLTDYTITTDRLSTPGAGLTYTLGTLAIGNQNLSVKGGDLVTNGIAGVTFGATTLSGSPIFTVTDPPNGGGTKLTLGAVSGTGMLTLSNATAMGNITVAGAQTQTGDLILLNNGASNNGITVSGAPNHTGRIVNAGTGAGSTLISGIIGPNVTEVIQASETSVLALGGANTFTCGITVSSNRTVRIANASAAGATGTGDVNINEDGTIDGSGVMAGTVILADGGTLSPSINGRTAAGTMSIGDLEWHGGGVLDYVVTKIEGAVGGVDYGQIYVDGDLTDLPGATNLIIRLDTLGQTLAYDPALNYGLKLITFGTEGMATNLNLATVQLDTNAFWVAGGTWSLTNMYNAIYLVSEITEPAPGVNIWIAADTYAYWAVSNNWSLGRVPLPTDDVLFDYHSTTPCWIDDDVTNSVGSITVASGYPSTLTLWTVYPGLARFTDMKVNGDFTMWNGVFQHLDHAGYLSEVACYRISLDVGGDFTLGPNASINLDGLGFGANRGPGAGLNGVSALGRSASHGGAGANNPVTSSTYGSITQPESLGSGASGPGGGAIFLRVGGTATLDGLVTAQGTGGSATLCPGSGGSIYVKAANIAGSGTLQAGVSTLLPAYYGSGGGRIAVIATNGTSLGTLTFRANPHTQALNGGGRAGTIYQETTAFKRLIIDQENIGASSTNYTVLPAPTETFATPPAIGGALEDTTLIMTNGAFVSIEQDLRMGNLAWLNGELSLMSHTLYLKAAAPAGAFPADYGAGTVTLPGVFFTFANGDELTRDGRLLWGDPATTWRVITMVHDDVGGTATNKNELNEDYFGHGSALEFEATPTTLTFRFWDGTIPDGKPSSTENPLNISSLGGNSVFRAWFADVIPNQTNLEWVPTSGSDDWFAPYNWDLLMVPVAGQNVTIPAGSTVRLSAQTPALGTFTIAPGSTLTFDGWNSFLEATTLTVNGRLTHLPQTIASTNGLGEWVPQHRIWLKGNSLTVAATGMLDADGKGYRPGAGPGAAPAQFYGGDQGAGYNCGGGGGYGGPGAAIQSQKRGEAYGIPNDPWQPGSGGGYRAAYFGDNARPGGGAIRVDMTGLVTVDGIVSARGTDVIIPNGTAGSGGGIAIYSQTFAGATSGWVRADGGMGGPSGGSGGGGRIALHYNTTAQAAMPDPRPPVRISATPGYILNPATSATTVLPVMGTLYLPDTTLLAATPTGDAVLNEHRFWNVRLYLGSHPSSWSPASLTIENCLVGFPENYTLQVGGNLTLSSTKAPLNGTERAGLHLFATNSVERFASLLRVGGSFTIGSNTWFYPHTDGYSAAIVGTRVGGNFTVASGGGVNADMDGYIPVYGNTNGPGASLAGRTGGSYGGWGGVTNRETMTTNGIARPPYGNAAIPLEAGSPGGWRGYGNYTSAGRGGGAIHVLAGGRMLVDGTLTANGGMGVYHEGSGGSGGSIFLTCACLRGAGTLQARGGTRAAAVPSHPGGGGRIAVWQYLSVKAAESRVASLYTGGLKQEDSLRGFGGVVNVAAASYDDGATAGTAAFYSSSASAFILR